MSKETNSLAQKKATSTPSWKDGLNPKQARFVEEYLVDLNGTQAAIRAGYSVKTASEIAYQHLRKAKIAEAIDKALAERPGITRTRIVDELAMIGFANMRDYIEIQSDGTAYVDLSGLTRDQAAAINELTVDQYVEGSGDEARAVKRVRFKLSDKQAALEKLGRTLRMFTDKHELTGKDGEQLAPETNTRDLARAVLDILRTAKTGTPD